MEKNKYENILIGVYAYYDNDNGGANDLTTIGVKFVGDTTPTFHHFNGRTHAAYVLEVIKDELKQRDLHTTDLYVHCNTGQYIKVLNKVITVCTTMFHAGLMYEMEEVRLVDIQGTFEARYKNKTKSADMMNAYVQLVDVCCVRAIKFKLGKGQEKTIEELTALAEFQNGRRRRGGSGITLPVTLSLVK